MATSRQLRLVDEARRPGRVAGALARHGAMGEAAQLGMDEGHQLF
jgi:hypothetical protein